MRIGILLLPTDPWPETVALARRLDAMGYDHLWTYDHLSWRRYRERAWHAAMPWLTGVAASTQRIRLGTMVASPAFRHPVTLAKEAMTLDHVSDGRLVLGVGAGGTGFDATVLGEPVPPASVRAARFAEFAEALDDLLNRGLTTYHGRYFTVDDARLLPGPVQRPRLPIAVAAAGRRTLEVVARHGDAWITFGDPEGERTAAATERAVRAQAEILAAHCERMGRDPGTIDRIYLVGNTDERPLASVEAFTDFVGRYAGLGFTDIVFHHPRPGDPVWTDDPEIVERIAVDLLPELRTL